MAKPFSNLRDKMSPESQLRARAKVKAKAPKPNKGKHTLESVLRAIDRHRGIQLKRDMMYGPKGKPMQGQFADPHVVIMGSIGQKMLGMVDYLRKCHPKIKVIDKTAPAAVKRTKEA